METDELERLAPKKWGTPDCEPLTDYLDRVGPLLPNFPEPVLEDWFHRHGSSPIDRYAWVDFKKLAFVEECWAVEAILDRVRSWPGEGESLVNNHRDWLLALGEKEPCYLENYMLENGTWPTPIVVLANDGGLITPNGLVLGEPYHLLEGHRRLGFLRALAQGGLRSPADEHALWVCHIESPP